MKRAAALVTAAVLAGCAGGGGARSARPPTTTAPTTAPSATVQTQPSTPTTVTTCTNATVVAGWSLPQKAAELVVVPVLGADPAAVSVAIAQGAGGILLLGPTPAPATLKAALAPARGRLMVMVDEEGGEVQRLVPDVQSLPWPRTMAATMTPDQVRASARSLGRQMQALGVDVDLAPVLDVDAGPALSAADPDGPRSFSANPSVAATYGTAFLQGLHDAGVLAVVKHFPGLGGSSGNTDFGPAATRPVAALQSSGLPPFERAVAAGARAVMVANATVPGLTTLPASVSPAAVDGLLRNGLGFDGLVLTDSLSAGALRSAGYSVPSAAAAAVGAGADMVLFGSTLTASDSAQLAPGPLAATTRAVVAAIVAAARSGAIPEARLDAAVAHVVGAEGRDICG